MYNMRYSNQMSRQIPPSLMVEFQQRYVKGVPLSFEPKRTLSPNLTSRHPISVLLILFQRKRLANYTTRVVRGV